MSDKVLVLNITPKPSNKEVEYIGNVIYVDFVAKKRIPAPKKKAS